MKQLCLSMILFAAITNSLYASSSTVVAAAQAATNAATSSVSQVCQLAYNNPHIVAGLALFMSRPLLGLIMQAEEYSLARLAGLAVTSNQNNSQAVVNVGGFALHATTLTDEQVQDSGFVGIHITLQEAADPATSGSAHEISVRAAKKDNAAGQGVVQELQGLVAGNMVWALQLSANIGNYGVQGTVGLSDVVLAVLGALAVAALQATGQVPPAAEQSLVDALSQAELQQLASGLLVQK